MRAESQRCSLAFVAKLMFFFGTMGSGKSTQALQIHHNLTSTGLSVILTTQLDRDGARSLVTQSASDSRP